MDILFSALDLYYRKKLILRRAQKGDQDSNRCTNVRQTLVWFFRARYRDEKKTEDAFEVENIITVQRLIISLSLKSVEKSAVRAPIREIKRDQDRLYDQKRDLETRSDLLEFLLMLNSQMWWWEDHRCEWTNWDVITYGYACVRVCKDMCVYVCMCVRVALYMKRKKKKKRYGERRESRDLTEICISVYR